MDTLARQLSATAAHKATVHEAGIDTRCITIEEVQEHLVHVLDTMLVVANGVEMEDELVHVFSLHFDIMMQCLHLGLSRDAFTVVDAVLMLRACHFWSEQALLRCIRDHSLFTLEALTQLDTLEMDYPIITLLAACIENGVLHVWRSAVKGKGLVPHLRDAAQSNMQIHVVVIRMYSNFMMDDSDLDRPSLYQSMIQEVAIATNGVYQLVLEEAASLQPVYSSLHLVELNNVYSSIGTEMMHAIAVLAMQDDDIAALLLKSVDWKASSLTISRHVLRAFTSQEVIQSSQHGHTYKDPISAGMLLLSIYIRESRYFKQAEQLFYEYLVMVILCLSSGNVRLIDTVSQLIRADESLFRVLTHDGFTLQRLDSKLSGAFLSLLKEHKLTFSDEQREFENIGDLSFLPQVLFSTLEEIPTPSGLSQQVYTPSHCIDLALYLIQCGQSGTFTIDAMLQLVRPTQSPSLNHHIVHSICTMTDLDFNQSLVSSLANALAQLDANPVHRATQMVLIQCIDTHVSTMKRGSEFTFFAEAVFFKLCRCLKQALAHKNVSFGEQLLQPMTHLYHVCGSGFTPIASTILLDVIALDLFSSSAVYVETILLDDDFPLLFHAVLESQHLSTKAVLRVLNQVKERTTEQYTRRSIPGSWSPYLMQLSQHQLDHVRESGQSSIAYTTMSTPLWKTSLPLKEAITEAISHSRHSIHTEPTSGIVASIADMKGLAWIIGLLKQDLLYGSQQRRVIDHVSDPSNIHLVTQLYASGCNGSTDLMISYIESIHTCMLLCLSRGTLSQMTIEAVHTMISTVLALPSIPKDLIYNVLQLVLTLQSYCEEESTIQFLACSKVQSLLSFLEQSGPLQATLFDQMASRLLAFVVAIESVCQRPESESPLHVLVHHATAVQEFLAPVDLRDAFLRAHCQTRLRGESQSPVSVFFGSVLLCASLEHKGSYVLSVTYDWIRFRRTDRHNTRERDETQLSVRFDTIKCIERGSVPDECILYWGVKGNELHCRLLFPSEVDTELFVMYVSTFSSVHGHQQDAPRPPESRVQVVQEGLQNPTFSVFGYLDADCSAASRCILQCTSEKNGYVIEIEAQSRGTFLSYLKRSPHSFNAREIQKIHMRSHDSSVSLVIQLLKGHKTVYFPSTLACSRGKGLLERAVSSTPANAII